MILIEPCVLIMACTDLAVVTSKVKLCPQNVRRFLSCRQKADFPPTFKIGLGTLEVLGSGGASRSKRQSELGHNLNWNSIYLERSEPHLGDSFFSHIVHGRIF